MGICMREARIGEGGEETFVYADNVAMMVDSAVVLQNIVDMWNLAMTQKGMKINTARCKTEMEEFNINMGEEQANQVTQYTYLGVEVDAQNLQDTEINSRIRKYIGSDHMMYVPDS